MLHQVPLFDRGQPRYSIVPERFRPLDLSDGAWVQHPPRLLSGHDALYTHLRNGCSWRTERRTMYDRDVDVPRLMARIPRDGPGHPVLTELSHDLSKLFGRELVNISCNLYRDGADSEAEHNDRMGPLIPDTVIAILSVGAPRLFLMRPKGGGTPHRFHLGWGDLLVMGGSTQVHWNHGVPKQRGAAGRISVMFRETIPAD